MLSLNLNNHPRLKFHREIFVIYRYFFNQPFDECCIKFGNYCML